MMSDNKSRECCTIQSIMHYLLVWTFEEVEVEGKKKRNRFGRKEVKKIVTVLINNVHCVGTQRLIHNR